MAIGEALGYPCLVDRGGECLIQQGQEVWSHFARTQRGFLIMLATEEAIITCQHTGISVPDLSSEVAH